MCDGMKAQGLMLSMCFHVTNVAWTYRHTDIHLELLRSVLSLDVKTGVNGSPVWPGKRRLAVQSVTKRSTNSMSTLLRRLCPELK